MINGFDKLIKQEFKFPIMNADEAMYRIDSVNEVKEEGSDKWHGVLGCRYLPNPQLNYQQMPEYVVFTIHCENRKYKIIGMITNQGSQSIEVKGNDIDTMDKFLNELKRIAILFDKVQ